METFDFFPLVRGDVWHKLKSERTWTCGHRFSLDSWHRIYNDIILFQSWDDDDDDDDDDDYYYYLFV